MENRNEKLDIVKAFACIGVIIMHCSFPGTLGKCINYLFKFAVPIFFMISGYFLNKNDLSKKLKYKILKTMKLLIIAELFYLIFNLVLSFFGIIQIDDLLLKSNDIIINVFTGTFFNGTLWFLYSLLYSYIIIYIFRNTMIKRRRIFIISLFLLVLHIIVRIILKSIDIYDVRIFRSCILYGLPFMMIGYYFNSQKGKLVQLSLSKTSIIFMCGYILSLLEYFVFKQSLDFYFGTIISSIVLFVYCISNKELIKNKITSLLCFIGEKLSMYVYIIHLAVITLVSFISKNIIYLYLKPILAIIVSLILSYIYYLLKEKRKKIR